VGRIDRSKKRKEWVGKIGARRDEKKSVYILEVN
jgi:hypothetical protein